MLDIFTLLRNWFNWCFENPEKISPNHTALYVFCIEHCNRLGWKEKFGLPTTMAMEAIGIKSYNTYKKTINDLVAFGFVKMIEVSKNQYSANIIAISKNDKAFNKALDKATAKHTSKQSESTRQSNDSIDIHNTIIQNTNYNETDFFIMSDEKIKGNPTDYCLNNFRVYVESMIMNFGNGKVSMDRFENNFRLNHPNGSVFTDDKHLRNTVRSSIKKLADEKEVIKYVSQIPAAQNKW